MLRIHGALHCKEFESVSLLLLLQAKRQAALLKKRLGKDIELNEFEMVRGEQAISAVGQTTRC
jgi:hypothetical protein